MGSNDGESCEKPVHRVTVDDFYIGKYEVTNNEYIQFLNSINCSSNGSYNGKELIDMDYEDCAVGYSGGDFYFKGSKYADKETCPVICVTWYGAVEYCKWLSETTSRSYRLPTETEWEYVAGGGNKSSGYKYSGSDNIDQVAWHWKNSGDNYISGDWNFYKIIDNNRKVHTAGTKEPNELGIYDMTGNVWEWCSDWYGENYYSSSPDKNPAGPGSDSNRVLRGGSWGDPLEGCRLSFRSCSRPSSSHSTIGFRLACSTVR